MRRNLVTMNAFAARHSEGKERRVHFRFLLSPVEILTDADAISNLVRALNAPDKAQMIIGSSSGNENSFECVSCQNGYFTQSLLNAFMGIPVNNGNRIFRPDADNDGFIQTYELDNYIKEAVNIAAQNEGRKQSVHSKLTAGFHFPIIKPKSKWNAHASD